MLLHGKLDTTWQCVLAEQKASCILGCNYRSVAIRSREVIQYLYSWLVRPHPLGVLQPVLEFPTYNPTKDMYILEKVQRKAIEMLRGLDHLWSLKTG